MVIVTNDHDGVFMRIPNELVLHILLCLGTTQRAYEAKCDIFRWAATCKRHATLALDPAFWRRMRSVHFPDAIHTRDAAFGKDDRWVFCARTDVRRVVKDGPGMTDRQTMVRLRRSDGTLFDYCGDLIAGLPQGYGVGFFRCEHDPAGNYERYDGVWHDGRPHGQIVVDRYHYGERTNQYDGTMACGARHGYGQERDRDHTYKGSWRDDQFHGYGRKVNTDGRAYEGAWKTGSRHGYGIMTTKDGVTRRGQWHHGWQNGFGVLTFSDGSLIIGVWDKGPFHPRRPWVPLVVVGPRALLPSKVIKMDMGS